MSSINEIFASNVFNDSVMRERLPKETYKALQRTIKDGRSLDPNAATVVANAMKDWAIEKGATHYTHWFQPLTSRFRVCPQKSMTALFLPPRTAR